MRIEHLPLEGVVLLGYDTARDDRGSFRRVIDLGDLAGLGLDSRVSQVSAATNDVRGTVRGMHYQARPHEESKTIWCTRGSVFDVLVDVRPEQPTYGTWCSVTLADGDGLDGDGDGVELDGDGDGPDSDEDGDGPDRQ